MGKIAKISMRASDIIVAIPYMKALGVTDVLVVQGAVIMYHVLPDWHPMNHGGVEYVLPFIRMQGLNATSIPYSELVNHTFDIDMDLKYKFGWNLDTGDLYTINALFHGVYPDMTKNFLHVEEIESTNSIVFAHTARHINPYIDFTILNDYENPKLFIGTEAEYIFFTNYIINGQYKYKTIDMHYINTSDMYEAAKLIKASQLFISNQTSFAVVAEGISHKRILCVDKASPTLITKTANGRSVLTQRHFEKSVHEMLI